MKRHILLGALIILVAPVFVAAFVVLFPVLALLQKVGMALDKDMRAKRRSN